MFYNTYWSDKHQKLAEKVFENFMFGKVMTQRGIKSKYENRLGWSFKCPNDERDKNKRSAYIYVQLNDGKVVGITGKCHRCRAEWNSAEGLRKLMEAINGQRKSIK